MNYNYEYFLVFFFNQNVGSYDSRADPTIRSPNTLIDPMI